MAFQKRYTAKQAAEAVLKKTHELLEKSELQKKYADLKAAPDHQMNKAEPVGKKPEKDADQHAEGKAPKGEIHPKEKEAAPSDEVRDQKAPEKNADEQKEGNNELAGTTPNQVGQDGKNIPGFDEMKGHIKLAKFIGHMEAKRKMGSQQ